MKKGIYFCFLLIVTLFACGRSGESGSDKDITRQTLRVDSGSQRLSVGVAIPGSWTVTGATEWCVPDKTSGTGSATLLITVEPNPDTKSRTATLTVAGETKGMEITVIQGAADDGTGYKLPVIFHVLYNDPNAVKQNIPTAVIHQMIADCNTIYLNCGVDMNLEFVAATKDPDGNTLEEPGIERIEWPVSVVMDDGAFMENKEYARYMWDQNKYINIVLFPFENELGVGIAYMPYSVTGLPGLSNGSYYLNNLPDYPHCIAINSNTTMGDMHPAGLYTYGTLGLAHELGHYMGLFHAFSVGGCDQTDYCDDTPNYNRTAYEEWLNRQSGQMTFQALSMRNNCAGGTFSSTNIMDYDYSYQTRFTVNQQERIREVLRNSPMIPRASGTQSLKRPQTGIETTPPPAILIR